jgi:hypothetical protein
LNIAAAIGVKDLKDGVRQLTRIAREVLRQEAIIELQKRVMQTQFKNFCSAPRLTAALSNLQKRNHAVRGSPTRPPLVTKLSQTYN